MSRKISEYFKIESKNCDLGFVEVKNEMEASFEIKLEEIKVEASLNPPEVRDCRVLLQDIKKDTEIDGIGNLISFKSKSKAAKKGPRNSKRTLKPGQFECKFCSSMMLERNEQN